MAMMPPAIVVAAVPTVVVAATAVMAPPMPVAAFDLNNCLIGSALLARRSRSFMSMSGPFALDFKGIGLTETSSRLALLESLARYAKLLDSVCNLQTEKQAALSLVADAELFRHCCKHASLRHAARCALENSKTFLSDANSIMILTDPTGLIIDTQGR
jgi:hypothetical protein